MSESKTEKIFRDFYKGEDSFIEKADIPKKYGFMSKKKTGKTGYPDFFKECGDYVIVVEAKGDDFSLACEEMQFYIENNKKPDVDMIGIAISGQNEFDYSARLSIRLAKQPYKVIVENGKLLELSDIRLLYIKEKYSDFIGDDELVKVLNKINKILQGEIKVKDTQRSLFFSGIMIALTDNSFKNSYRYTKQPSPEEISAKKWFVCHKLNESILTTISDQISTKVNNLSKEYNWKDCFSFIRNIDYDLDKYIQLISYIEDKIFVPYTFNQKSDILGKAYKIFLSKAGKIDNKNIILTPEHIKQLMIDLHN